MKRYYEKGLAAERLRKVYDIAPPRTLQYLQAEIDFVLEHINPSDSVLELGCGYGRIIKLLATGAKNVCGIDTSQDSLRLAREYLRDLKNIQLLNMNASDLAFNDDTFDKVLCIQNGISAFHVDPEKLIRESIRVAARDGLVFFSSYSDKFWDARLEWFRVQSEHGLLGEIDWNKTKEGTIFCKDGFHATTFTSDDFKSLMSRFDVSYKIHEVDDSSIFYIISKR